MVLSEEIVKNIRLEKSAEKTENAYLLGAFDKNEKLFFKLTLPKELYALSPVMEIYRDDDESSLSRDFALAWVEDDKVVYQLTLSLSELCICEDGGLFFYSVSFMTSEGRIRLSYDRYSYSPKITWYDEEYTAYQITAFSNLKTPEWIKGAVMYQIFPDRFSKGGDVKIRKDAVMIDDWYNGVPEYVRRPGDRIENNCFFGGTLYGVAEKLDYIKSLGVNCIYLNPIFEAYSNHKYDTGDYSKVDEMFGGDKALELLLAEAEKRDIRIILDGVFNHTGSDSIYFNRRNRYDSIGAYNSKESPYYSWYDFDEYPEKYRSWWGVDVLPSVNTANEAYNEMINGENGIVRKYIRRGTGGWRLDVADELQEVFLKRLYKAAKAENPEALVLGEVWEDASNKIAYGYRRHYFRGGELDSAMNYPFRTGIIDYLVSGNSKELYAQTHTIYSHYPKDISDCLMNMLGTHDTERILTALSGIDVKSMGADMQRNFRLAPSVLSEMKEKLKIAYLILATLPGVPCIYYGDEAGMQGCRDPFNRMPYPWGREDKKLIAYFRKIGKIRRREKIFKKGYFKLIDSYPDGCFAFERFEGGERVRVVVNLADYDIKLGTSGYELLRERYCDEGYALKKGECAILKAQSI